MWGHRRAFYDPYALYTVHVHEHGFSRFLALLMKLYTYKKNICIYFQLVFSTRALYVINISIHVTFPFSSSGLSIVVSFMVLHFIPGFPVIASVTHVGVGLCLGPP